MDFDAGGSSTESEYYGASDEDEESLFVDVGCTTVPLASAHGGASATHADPQLGDAAPVGANSPVAALTTRWNNVLTADLAAVAARVAQFASTRREPLAIPVESLPQSLEFVSPFAQLADVTRAVKSEEQEAEEAATSECVETVVAAAASKPSKRVATPAVVVIDLSLDSDDDDGTIEHPPMTTGETPTNCASQMAQSNAAPRWIQRVEARRTPTTERSTSPTYVNRPTQHKQHEITRTETTTEPSTAQVQASHSHPVLQPAKRPPRSPAPASTRVAPSISAPVMAVAAQSSPRIHERQPVWTGRTDRMATPQQARSTGPVPAGPQRTNSTLSCTRCHRLVPYRASLPAHANYDCKCCGVKYTRDELAVRGANRRCRSCHQPGLVQPPPVPARPPACVSHPRTPVGDVALHEASISPAAQSTSVPPRPLGKPLQLSTRTLRPSSRRSLSIVPHQQQTFSCVTCHQHLGEPTPTAPMVEKDVDPWFCTCCQCLFDARASSPEKNPVGSALEAPRCTSCAIAACDLDARLEARRPKYALLLELRRLSKLLDEVLERCVRRLVASGRTAEFIAMNRNSIKCEIDQRLTRSKLNSVAARNAQRKALCRGGLSHSESGEMFREQVKLDEEEVDVRTRLIAFVAVCLHDNGVELPEDVRGIIPKDNRSRRKPDDDRSRQKPTQPEQATSRQPTNPLKEILSQPRPNAMRKKQRRTEHAAAAGSTVRQSKPLFTSSRRRPRRAIVQIGSIHNPSLETPPTHQRKFGVRRRTVEPSPPPPKRTRYLSYNS